MFKKSWTKKLNIISTKPYYISFINIGIEGPYGIELDYKNCKHIILIAGGVSITPMHNIFFTLYNFSINNKYDQLPTLNYGG